MPNHCSKSAGGITHLSPLSLLKAAFLGKRSETVSSDNKLVGSYIYRLEGKVSNENHMINAEVISASSKAGGDEEDAKKALTQADL